MSISICEIPPAMSLLTLFSSTAPSLGLTLAFGCTTLLMLPKAPSRLQPQSRLHLQGHLSKLRGPQMHASRLWD